MKTVLTTNVAYSSYHPAGVLYLSAADYKLHQAVEQLNEGTQFSAALIYDPAVLPNGATWTEDGRVLLENVRAEFGFRADFAHPSVTVTLTTADAAAVGLL